MAEAAVSFAVETLGKLLIEKAIFLQEVKGEVEWVRDELKRMQCFLKDAVKKQSDSDSIRNWISDIRKVAHDAEDAIEMYVLKVQSRGLCDKCTCFPNHVYQLNKVGEEIKSIRQKLKDIGDSRRTYDIQGVESSTLTRSQLQVETWRRLAYWQNDKQVVGLEKDVDILLGKSIFEKSKGLSIAAVLGMGGIGKSTLARKIYNHPAIVEEFEFRAWVVVSSEFTPEDIMKQILHQLRIPLDDLRLLESINDKQRRQEDLKKELNKRLIGKRYFIVLDDVWEAIHWESLSSAFPNGDESSRMLLTSRNQILTMHNGYVHEMKVLDDNQSWELLLRKTLIDNNDEKWAEELTKVGKEILKKCGGLPLAISVVGGLLARKRRSKSEWEKVLKEMKSHMDRRGDISTISAILELSYQNIAPELKVCFLYLGFFKEDTIIEAEQLVHIWVAQGLVPLEVVGEEERIEDVAREYLNELISRNMVQVKEMEYDRVQGCQMHDLLRDLSIRKAKEEIDFEEVREEMNLNQCSLSKPRHRAIYYSKPSFIYLNSRNQYLRSLFICASGKAESTKGGPSSYWKSFELLRVLHLGNATFEVLPKAIGDLAGLRCLTLECYNRWDFGEVTISRTGRMKLPRSWAKLKNLEVLDLRVEGRHITINKAILKMHSLRHLYLSTFRSKVSLVKMRKLETLTSLWVKDSADLWMIQGMANITKLGLELSPEVDGSTLFTYLVGLKNLAYLTLRGGPYMLGHYKMDVRELELRLSENFHPNLSFLTLSRIELAGDLMKILEKLPKLLFLKLHHSSFEGEEMVISGFPSLKVLHLEGIESLKNLVIKEGAMPELNRLIIRECPNLNVENLSEHLKSVISNHAN